MSQSCEDTMNAKLGLRSRSPMPVATRSSEADDRVSPTPEPTVGAEVNGLLGLQVVVARQGIYRSDRSVDGYELFFQNDSAESSKQQYVDSEQMTTDVLEGALTIGLEQLVGDRRLYLNVHESLLAEPWDLWLPPDRTVIEVLETVGVNDELLAGCGRLVDLGFSVALTDFTWFDGAERLLELASIVKIDPHIWSNADRAQLTRLCEKHDVSLLAQNIDSHATVSELRDEGFTLFQGHALEQPEVVAGRTVERTALARLRTAAVMLEDDLEIESLEQIIRPEPGLAYQIIRLASIGRPGEMRRNIDSLRQAVVILGSRRTQQFLAMLLSRPPSREWEPTFVTVLARARACEILTGVYRPSSSALAFAAGLISGLDAVFGVSVAQIVSSMDLSDALESAILDPTSDVGKILADLISFQRGDRSHVPASAATPKDIENAFGQGFAWATHTLSMD
jgi:c-di-GMP-related signal transduction protein